MPSKIMFYGKDSRLYTLEEIFAVDKLDNTLVGIEYFHYKTHEGVAYTANRTVTHGAGASPNILIVTPDSTTKAHFFFQAVSDAALTVTFYESADYIGGTSLSSYNRDRNSPNSSSLVLTYDATDDGGGKGTGIWVFSGGANKEVVMSNREHMEFILKRNTKYLLETVGTSGDIITILTDWYEVKD